MCSSDLVGTQAAGGGERQKEEELKAAQFHGDSGLEVKWGVKIIKNRPSSKAPFPPAVIISSAAGA